MRLWLFKDVTFLSNLEFNTNNVDKIFGNGGDFVPLFTPFPFSTLITKSRLQNDQFKIIVCLHGDINY